MTLPLKVLTCRFGTVKKLIHPLLSPMLTGDPVKMVTLNFLANVGNYFEVVTVFRLPGERPFSSPYHPAVCGL